jgi:hypothetical protein
LGGGGGGGGWSRARVLRAKCRRCGVGGSTPIHAQTPESPNSSPQPETPNHLPNHLPTPHPQPTPNPPKLTPPNPTRRPSKQTRLRAPVCLQQRLHGQGLLTALHGQRHNDTVRRRAARARALRAYGARLRPSVHGLVGLDAGGGGQGRARGRSGAWGSHRVPCPALVSPVHHQQDGTGPISAGHPTPPKKKNATAGNPPPPHMPHRTNATQTNSTGVPINYAALSPEGSSLVCAGDTPTVLVYTWAGGARVPAGALLFEGGQ